MVIRSKQTVADRSGKRVWLYARRSDASGDRARSVDEQLAKGRADTARAGDLVDREWTELGSGTSGKGRPVFSTMIETALALPSHARPHRIWFLDSSRFSRMTVPEAFSYIHQLQEVGVAIDLGIDQEKVTGEAAYIMLTVLLTGNRAYAVTTAFKVALGHAAALAAGRWPGGREPYGYAQAPHPSGRGKTLVIVDDQAKIVRRIYDDYEGGLSPLAIAAALTRDGILPARGGKWHGATVRQILANRTYVGDSSLHDDRPGRTISRPQFYRASESGPLEAGTTAPALIRRDTHPAIIGRDQWERVQVRRQERATYPTGGTPMLLGKGIATCGVCGAPMKAGAGNTTKTRRYRYYVCSSRQHHGAWTKPDCGQTSVRDDRLEPDVLAAVRGQAARLDPEQLARDLRAALPSAPRVDVAAIEKRRRALATRRDELALDTSLDAAFLRGALTKLADEDARLAQQIEAARMAEARGFDVDAAVTAAVEAVRRLDAPETDEGREALREVLRLFVHRLEVMPAPRGALKPVKLEVYEPQAIPFLATGNEPWCS
ncbi:MAG: recombinase family protein [Planctomycetota bacterium]|nr:recombinase family protein [Planctomycetota bacterium]